MADRDEPDDRRSNRRSEHRAGEPRTGEPRTGDADPERVWPRPLRPGDRVCVVAPSGPCDPVRVGRGVEVLRSWGLEVDLAAHVLSGPGAALPYLAADDRTRADELTAAWSDPRTAAVWAARGGYGAQRMVDLVDADALRAAGPKPFVGFSDITALHEWIGRVLGQVTVHGPVTGSVEQLGDPASVSRLKTLLMSEPAPGLLLAEGLPLVPGSAVGRLVGGNLSLLASGVGVEPAPAGPSIALVEDVDEQPYRVDRMLTQLSRSGWFDQVVAVLVGDLTRCGDPGLLDRVLADRLSALGVPVLTGARAGHGAVNLALPLGARVELDATGERAQLTLA